MHKKFMKESPDGKLTKAQFMNLYNMKGAKGDAESIAGHLFRAFDLNNNFAIGKIMQKVNCNYFPFSVSENIDRVSLVSLVTKFPQ